MLPKIKINEFFVEGENQDLSHVLLHIIQPSTSEEEKEKGYFFAACEINNGRKEDVVNLQNLMDEIENDYYETPNQPGKETLELILEKINSENFALSDSSAELHCLIGALRGDELVFSFRGRPEAILFYKNKLGQHQIMDLVAANENDEQENGDKLFSQIIQGKISAGDYFFGGTSHIGGCFNHDRMQKIITGRAPEQSADHFEKVLSGIKNGYSYGGVIMFREPEIEAIKTADKIEPEKKPIFTTEEQTDRTLSPSLMNNLNSKVKSMMDKDVAAKPRPIVPTNIPQTISPHVKQRPARPMAGKSPAEIIMMIIRAIGIGLKYFGYSIYWLFFMLAKFIVGIGRFAAMLFIVVFNFKNRRRSILESWSEGRRRFTKRLRELPLITKILAVAAIIFAIVFVISTATIQARKIKDEANKVYLENLQTIKNKVDAAESALIYGDESSAKATSAEAKTLFTAFTCAPVDKTTCDDIISRLDALSLKLRKMDTVAAELIVDWNSMNLTGLEKFIKIDTKLIGYSSTSGALAVYDTLTKTNKTISASDATFAGFIASAVPKENDYVAFIGADNKSLALYDPKTDTLKKGEISFAGTPDIRSIIIYNRRMYSLDAAANQVLRHDNIKNGFGLGKDWLQDTNQNIRDGVDLAIDGDLFVLKTDGQILKFTKGVSQNFSLQTIDPALDSGNDIWTYTDSVNLYVLDAKNKRLITFDKTGQFLRQITANDFTSPVSAAIDETSGSAYILDSGKVYKIHIK
ncbi:MAG: hypothetical protein WC457_03445 [Patescibacteria group bacterium]